YCGACRDAPSRVCANHRKVSCEHCGNNITEAHVDLAYVGHADVTDRLNAVDPWWSWAPAHHEVDKDVLLAAIATNNADIVRMVIDNAPPMRDSNGGMWIDLTIHDDDGRPVTKRGYGDCEKKTGPAAVKELVGDCVRVTAIRFGVA